MVSSKEYCFPNYLYLQILSVIWLNPKAKCVFIHRWTYIYRNLHIFTDGHIFTTVFQSLQMSKMINNVIIYKVDCLIVFVSLWTQVFIKLIKLEQYETVDIQFKLQTGLINQF